MRKFRRLAIIGALLALAALISGSLFAMVVAKNLTISSDAGFAQDSYSVPAGATLEGSLIGIVSRSPITQETGWFTVYGYFWLVKDAQGNILQSSPSPGAPKVLDVPLSESAQMSAEGTFIAPLLAEGEQVTVTATLYLLIKDEYCVKNPEAYATPPQISTTTSSDCLMLVYPYDSYKPYAATATDSVIVAGGAALPVTEQPTPRPTNIAEKTDGIVQQETPIDAGFAETRRIGIVAIFGVLMALILPSLPFKLWMRIGIIAAIVAAIAYVILVMRVI